MDLVHQLQDQVSIFLFSSFNNIYIKRLQKKVKLHENSFMYQYEAFTFFWMSQGFLKTQFLTPSLFFFNAQEELWWDHTISKKIHLQVFFPPGNNE